MLTPPSELPKLPEKVRGYLSIHLYTATQIIVTIVIFIVTLTIAGPAFPIIVIALVPIRLRLMNRIWNRETLRYVDAWACRDGTPEDDEDLRIESEKRQHRSGVDVESAAPILPVEMKEIPSDSSG